MPLASGAVNGVVLPLRLTFIPVPIDVFRKQKSIGDRGEPGPAP
jgi:hypothetical protein